LRQLVLGGFRSALGGFQVVAPDAALF